MAEVAPEASPSFHVEVLGCLSGECLCQLELSCRADVLDVKAQVESVTSLSRASQRLFHGSRQCRDHEELCELATQAGAVLQLRLVAVDAEWVQLCAAMEHGALRLQDIGEDLRTDPDMVLAAVRCSGLALEHAAEHFRRQRQLVLTAVRQNGLALRFAAVELQADREVVLTAVSRDGLSLEFASPALRAEHEVVLAAVRRNGFALQFALGTLCEDRDVVLAAVQSDGRALKHVAADLRSDREVVVAACADNNECAPYVPTELRKDPDVIWALMHGVRIGGDMGGVVSWGIGMRKYYSSLEEEEQPEEADFCSDLEEE